MVAHHHHQETMKQERMALQSQFLHGVLSGHFDPALLDGILPAKDLSPTKALQTYRDDYTARLTNALGEYYPALWSLLGDGDFFRLCHDYIREFHSSTYSLDLYGHRMPDFLKIHDLGKEHPFLPELALLEKEYLRIFHLPPADGLDEEYFKSQKNHPSLILNLYEGIFICHSQYPLYDLWQIKNAPHTSRPFALYKGKGVGQLSISVSVSVSVSVQFLSEFQITILKSLQKKVPLEDALTSSSSSSPQQIQELFQFLVLNRLIVSTTEAS